MGIFESKLDTNFALGEVIIRVRNKVKVAQIRIQHGRSHKGKTSYRIEEKRDVRRVARPNWFDEGGDGFGAYDEKVTGHSDQDPNDKPTQEEVYAALQELEP